jgi:hypothetical protein
MKKLGVINRNKKVEFIRDLTKEEDSIITNHVNILIEFDRQTEKFKTYKNSVENLRKLIKMNKHDSNFSREILEVMSTFRAFLDHWETEIKRKFGKKSSETNLFKAATSNEFDNYFSYRFFSGFRNYIQHVRVPYLHVHSSINDRNGVDTEISVNKKELIDTFDGWNTILIEDFKQQPNSINIIPLIDELYESVKRINLVAINLLDVKALYNSSVFLLGLINLQKGFKGDLILVEYEPIPGSKIKLKFLPISTAEFIVKNISIHNK